MILQMYMLEFVLCVSYFVVNQCFISLENCAENELFASIHLLSIVFVKLYYNIVVSL